MSVFIVAHSALSARGGPPIVHFSRFPTPSSASLHDAGVVEFILPTSRFLLRKLCILMY
jgi:hypothetical protein